ncbi:hypothetical protein VSS37_10625 [Candidatus Thiothrix sp. Deng01]|uniref:Cytochrome c domain-containing protein n=1 Tax=Candidatus Thiothrix phosphatis TaxID=3112415 RepID=A0ABU6CXD1_9GAMM|nr:hypothetical protein [Candidatus Thiothrix sp. Deng01]MEB4591434.1 hypothetical protein [Candidatus Thiothrix sp. Deng01]
MIDRNLMISGMLGLCLSACGGEADSGGTATSAASAVLEDLTPQTLTANQAAYIPPQCYTRTLDTAGRAHNPCMTCHIPPKEPNFVNDGALQLGYTFAEYANTNHWGNLFKDRSQQVAAISDSAILEYVRHNNYQSSAGKIDLAEKLKAVPAGWDFDKDGQWSGFVPDCYMNFDQEGFDRTPGNQYSGWRAFAYTPFLGTFWPTNGSTDDVIIRLGEPFRRNADGQFDLLAYKTNLAIVEALMTRQDVPVGPVDESRFGVDLDKDGTLAVATRIAFDWAPKEGRTMAFVGQAKAMQEAGQLHLAAGLFPEGTEFLHSVRYLDLDAAGKVKLAPRMKELRYARKTGWLTYSDLESAAITEATEKAKFPDRLRQLIGNVEQGMSNRAGWVYQGFIEDREGALRPQTFEETTACMGCHGGIGATSDSNFSFPRKLGHDSFQQGWYHWSQRGLQGVPEPKRADGQYEYTHYLEQNGAGDEFRENLEVISKFFDGAGNLNPDAANRLHGDIAELLLPSSGRALQLNKAYKTIVDGQDFIHGREAMVTPPGNVHESVERGQETGVSAIISGPR